MVCRTIGVSDQWCVGPMVCRTNGVSDHWCVGPMVCRTIGVSDQWCVGPMTCNPVSPQRVMNANYFNGIKRFAKSAIYSECRRQDDVLKRLANVPRISTLTLQMI